MKTHHRFWLTMGAGALFTVSTAFWWQQPQGLTDGEYTLSIFGGNAPINKVMNLVTEGGEIDLRADGISIGGYVSGTELTAYSTAMGGMLLHGSISGNTAKGDGVIQYKSKAPIYIDFSLTPKAANTTVVNNNNNSNPNNNSGGFPNADPFSVPSGQGGNDNNSDDKFGVLKDIRDGSEYKTVKIGNRVWTAENMRFNTNDGGSYFNTRNPKPIYGRHYTWTSAQKVCPSGWHLPTDDDWRELVSHLGPDAAAPLKAGDSWNNGGNGTNESGFAAYPAGFFSMSTRSFDFVGDQASFWTATEYFGPDAYAYVFNHSDKAPRRVSQAKTMGNSCRCVQN